LKELITALGSLVIIMVLILQACAGQIVFIKIAKSDIAIDNFRDVAKAEGLISEENSHMLQSALADICNISESEITVTGTRDMRKGGELIEYEIEYYIDNVVFMSSFLNISDEDNMLRFNEKNYVVSSVEKKENNKGEESNNNDRNDSSNIDDDIISAGLY